MLISALPMQQFHSAHRVCTALPSTPASSLPCSPACESPLQAQPVQDWLRAACRRAAEGDVLDLPDGLTAADWACVREQASMGCGARHGAARSAQFARRFWAARQCRFAQLCPSMRDAHLQSARCPPPRLPFPARPNQRLLVRRALPPAPAPPVHQAVQPRFNTVFPCAGLPCLPRERVRAPAPARLLGRRGPPATRGDPRHGGR